VLRRLSAAHRLGDRIGWASTEARAVGTDLLVVGGGPAGVAAASAAGNAGVQTTVLTAGPAGGRQPRETSSTDRAAADLASARAHGVEFLEDTMCIGYYGPEAVFAAVGPNGLVSVKAERVVVATGAYDRPAVVPGIDLPGVIGGRAFERLLGQGAFAPSQRIGAFAAPLEAARVVHAARRSGLELEWVASPEDADVEAKLHGGRRLRRIDGRGRVRGVTLEDGSKLRADVVVIGVSQPTYELQVHLGQEPSIEGAPPRVHTSGPTVLPMLEVGEAAGDLDPADAGHRARARTTSWLAGEAIPSAPVEALDPLTEGLDPAATVCICEDVTVAGIDLAIAEGFGDIELLKRRSGACTGACQGKLCLGPVGEVLLARGLTAGLPTMRPPVRPVSISSLAGVIG